MRHSVAIVPLGMVIVCCLLCSCQANPPLKVTPSQQTALDEVVIEVTREARTRRARQAPRSQAMF